MTIIERNLDISEERFQKYQKEYDEKYAMFEQAKQNIEKDFVKTTVKNPKQWNLDYTSCILTIKE